MLLVRHKAWEPRPHGLAVRYIRQTFGKASCPRFSWDSMPTVPRVPSLGCIICDVRGQSAHINSLLLPRCLEDTGKQRSQQLGWLCWSMALPSAKPAKATARTRVTASTVSAVNSLPSGSWEFPKTKGLRCAEEDDQMECVLASCSSSFVGCSKGLGSRFTEKCSQYPVGSWAAASLLSCTQLGTVALMLKEPTCQCRRHKRCRFSPWVGKIPLEKAMATTSSILDWKMPWTEEPSKLGPWNCKELDMTEVTWHARTRMSSQGDGTKLLTTVLSPLQEGFPWMFTRGLWRGRETIVTMPPPYRG